MLVVQALVFADGGLSALGLNVVNMALVGAFAGYGIFLLVRRVLRTAAPSIALAAGIAACAAPVLAAVVFVGEYALGGNDAVSPTSLAGAMIGVHAVIGIGEGVITALAVGSVLAVRPDLVHGARRTVPVPAASNRRRPGGDVSTTRRISTLAFVALALVAAVALVVLVAPHASADPDGLEKVSAETGIDGGAVGHRLAGSPLADYGVRGVESDTTATGIAGIAGIVATFAAGTGVVWLVRRRRSPPTPPADPADPLAA